MPSEPPFPTPFPPAPEPATELCVQRVQEYVWARYIQFRGTPFELDEEQALAVLAAHHQVRPLGEDSECFYYGILAYERSFADEARVEKHLRTAVQAFEAYRKQTAPDFRWEAVEDRYDDAMRTLQELAGRF